MGSIGYQSSPCTPHLCDTDHQIVNLYFDDMIWGKDEKAGSLLALIWAEIGAISWCICEEVLQQSKCHATTARLHVPLRALHVQP